MEHIYQLLLPCQGMEFHSNVYGESNIVNCAVRTDDVSDARYLFTPLNIKSSEIDNADNAPLTCFDFD